MANSSGLLVRNAAIAEVNSTYTLTDSVYPDDRLWQSADAVVLIRYIKDKQYKLSEDSTYTSDVATKGYAYYRLSDAGVYEPVETPAMGSSLEGLYILDDKSRWSMNVISRNQNDSSVIETEVYHAYSPAERGPYVGQTWILNSTNEPDYDITVTYWDLSNISVTEDTVTDEKTGQVTKTVTYTNLVTGDVYKDISVINTKTVYAVDTIQRMDYVNLMVNRIYRFQFVSEFAQLGWDPNPDNTTQPDNAGIYKVDKIMTYFDMITGGIDLYVNLYQKCGLSNDMYLADKERISQSVVYRLSDPAEPSKVYFMPQVFIKGNPDPSVIKFARLLLTIDLGVQPVPEYLEKGKYYSNGQLVEGYVPADSQAVAGLGDFESLKDFVTKSLEAMYGIVPVENGIDVMPYASVWLTDDAYGRIRKLREYRKRSSTVDLGTLFNLDKNNQLYIENRILKGKVGALEELVRTLNNR